MGADTSMPTVGDGLLGSPGPTSPKIETKLRRQLEDIKNNGVRNGSIEILKATGPAQHAEDEPKTIFTNPSEELL